MTVELLSDSQRAALLGVAALAGVAALLLRWRRAPAGFTAAAVAAAMAALTALALHGLLGLWVALHAPEGSDYNEYRWVLGAPWGRYALAGGVVATVLIVALSWLGTARIGSPWRRAALLGLRAAAAGSALLLFLEPAVELRQVTREPNRVAVLVDGSASMALADGDGAPTRAERVRALLDASDDTFAEWRKLHKIDFYSFADALTPSTREALGAAAPPTGRATLFRNALETLRAGYDGRDLAGVVLLSDGIDTGDMALTGAGEGEVRDFLRSLETRVHTVYAARPGLKDVAVARVLADEFAFVRTVLRVEAVVRSTGFEERRIPLVLSRDGEALRKKWVTLPAGETEQRVAFEFTPAKVGKYVYEIATPVAEGEAVAENNSRAFVVRVIRDKIRVLQVAGQPSWDVRALRGMLEANPNVDLISFFILRTLDDISNASNTELSLIPFPTRELFEEELPSFDLVVLQNFNYGPYQMAPYLRNIASYVEKGGGLVMLGGSYSFSEGDYAGTPIADVLPVDLFGPGATPMLDNGRFTPELTELGALHPVTALRFDRAANRELWKSLPQLEGANLLRSVRPGAAVLAVHPTLKTQDGRPLPVVVASDIAEGRSLAVTTDSLWRWGFVASGEAGNDGAAYAKFWENAIRWLTHDPELLYLKVSADAVEYQPGEAVHLEVRLSDRDYTPLAGGEVALEVMRGADPARVQSVWKDRFAVGEQGSAVRTLERLEEGVYRVRATAQVGGRPVTASEIFVIRRGSSELDHPSPDESLLVSIAAQTGGRYLGAVSEIPADLAFAEPRIVRVDQRTDLELWSRPWLLLAALLFLGLEWGLRQRSGYL